MVAFAFCASITFEPLSRNTHNRDSFRKAASILTTLCFFIWSPDNGSRVAPFLYGEALFGLPI
jgi:hypothetical protein